jgi:hypothetical protein
MSEPAEEVVAKRGPGRPPIRQEIREEVDVLKALREESLRNAVDRGSNEQDAFYVPPELIPEGWAAEWKATHVMGMELDAAYQAEMQRNGWVPAPVSIFKKMRPAGFIGKTIEQGGQMLMIRPKELSDRQKAKDNQNAKNLVQSKLQSLGMTKQGELDRKVQVVKKSYEAMEIPD